jgi:hypothetical protein
MPPASDPDLLVLHGLRLKWLATTETLGDVTGLDAGDVAERLDAFADKGWVRFRDGALTGWSLTPAGRTEATGRVTDEVAATGTRAAVEAAYGRFLAQNQRFLDICTDWQVLPAPPGQRRETSNDHRDADYDRKVIAELRAIDGDVQLVCAELAGILARFGSYGPRFTRALERVESGDTDWFTRPVLDSYHTVWFELHEDLLATLGIERHREGAA